MADQDSTAAHTGQKAIDGFTVPDRVYTCAAEGTGAGLCDLAFSPAVASVDFPHWLEHPVRQLYTDIRDSRSHHALLIHGPAGSGKRLLAESLIALLMCQSPTVTPRNMPVACGQCGDCCQLASANHIDLRVLGRSDNSEIIKIDDMRDFLTWLMITSRAPGSYRAGVIDSADELNASSANALLKTLEEPAAASVIVLISDNPRALPATIKSRCLLVPVSAVPLDATLKWLADRGVDQPASRLRQSHNAPFHALATRDREHLQRTQQMLQCFASIVTQKAGIAVCVERLKDYSVRECLQAFSEFISDILRVRAEAEASCLYPDEIPRWQSLAQQLSQQQWFALYRDLHKLMVIDNPSIKVQPVLETVFAAIWQTRELSSSLTVSD